MDVSIALENFTLNVERPNDDFFQETFQYPIINSVAILIYLIFGCSGSAGLVYVAWFERSGAAGPYRTLINQLVSFNLDQLNVYFLITTR